MKPGTSNIQSPQEKIAELHAVYVEATGLEIRLDMAREREWFEWQKRGFTADDLRLVVSHIRKGIREQKRNEGALKFRNLICNADFFEEDLAFIKAMKRQPKADSGRASVLRSSGRPEAVSAADAKHVSQVVPAGFLTQLKDAAK